MTSPSLVISTGSFFSGVIFEYSALAVPGATVEGTNSILSISPSSIAAMRTLRAKGEAGEKVSFMGGSLIFFVMPGLVPGIHDFLLGPQDVDGRVKPGHDALRGIASYAATISCR